MRNEGTVNSAERAVQELCVLMRMESFLKVTSLIYFEVLLSFCSQCYSLLFCLILYSIIFTLIYLTTNTDFKCIFVFIFILYCIYFCWFY